MRLDQAAPNTLALFRFAERRPLQGVASLVDWRVYGHLSRLVIEGFLSGDPAECLLMPLGRHLCQKQLLILGLGDRDAFDMRVFNDGLKKLFVTLRALGSEEVILSLPGRIEQIGETTAAMEQFLEVYEEEPDDWDVVLIEPLRAQKTMAPVLERWRLRQLMPA